MPDTTNASIAYGRLMHHAMRGLIQTVLQDVADHGLPGEHHFFITFDTQHPGVAIADWLEDRYPEEMTIVVQHWFDNLLVDDDGFGITLNFGDSPEPLRIPFDAIVTFVDPSVEFGLRFESTNKDADAPEDDPDVPPPGSKDKAKAKAKPAARSQNAEVVRLDAFRKGN